MVQPIDQGAILASGRQLVPDYAAQLMRERLMGLQEQQAETETARVAAAVEQQQRENRDEEEMRAALGRLGENPNPAALAELMMRYPRFSEAISRGVQTMDRARRDTDVQQLSEAHAAARGGHFDIAAGVLEQREAADREAGHEPDPITEAVIRGLRSSDPNEQRFAVDALERLTAASVGPEHYSSVYGTFSRRTGEMNGIIYDQDTGEALFQDPRGRIIPGSDGAFHRVAPIPGIPMIGGGAPAGTISETGAVPSMAPAGLVEPGNIDLSNRPQVRNRDGSVSTVLSISIGTDRGEVLIPRVINGRVVSEREAEDHYRATGEHLGIFQTPEQATAYGQQLHQREATRVAPSRGRQTANASTTLGSFDRPAATNIGRQFGTVTSTVRTPEHNREVGGARHSFHLAENGGRAIDIARRRGVSHAQILAAYRRAGYTLHPDTRDEGDHSHVVIAQGPHAGAPTGLPRVRSTQEYNRIPRGAQFVDPSGNVRTKS